MKDVYEDKLNSDVVYFDGDETNDNEGNQINELNFHCMVSFVDYQQLVLGMETLCNRNSSLEAELLAANQKITALENNYR
jgi:hypothetical protein